MGEFFGKLTNLSYELFGVLVPGLITSLFMLYIWASLGPMAPVVTNNSLPIFQMSDLLDGIDSLTTERGIGVVTLLLIGWYFLGHLILWISRSFERVPQSWPGNFRRMFLAVTFRFPRPGKSYDEKLEPLFQAVKKRFDTVDVTMEWRTFYPVAKNFLAQRVQYSLVATYQHKYTLHRSISCASVIWFWLLFVIAVYGKCGSPSPGPSFVLIAVGLVASLVVVWGFSGSFMYNWLMYGNTIITECYALFFGPKVDVGSGKPSSH